MNIVPILFRVTPWHCGSHMVSWLWVAWKIWLLERLACIINWYFVTRRPSLEKFGGAYIEKRSFVGTVFAIKMCYQSSGLKSNPPYQIFLVQNARIYLTSNLWHAILSRLNWTEPPLIYFSIYSDWLIDGDGEQPWRRCRVSIPYLYALARLCHWSSGTAFIKLGRLHSWIQDNWEPLSCISCSPTIIFFYLDRHRRFSQMI